MIPALATIWAVAALAGFIGYRLAARRRPAGMIYLLLLLAVLTAHAASLANASAMLLLLLPSSTALLGSLLGGYGLAIAATAAGIARGGRVSARSRIL